MTYKPQQLHSNWSLLADNSSFNDKSDTICGFVDTIGAQRPLRDMNEAGCASEQLNQVLAAVVYGLELSDSEPNNFESVNHGLRIILESCHLVSLRVEQYLALQARGER